MASLGMISMWASACVAWARRWEPRRATAEAARVEALRKARREDVEGDFSDMRKRSPVGMKRYSPHVCGASAPPVTCRRTESEVSYRHATVRLYDWRTYHQGQALC